MCTHQPEPREGQAGSAGRRRGLYDCGRRVVPVEERGLRCGKMGKEEGLREWLCLCPRMKGKDSGSITCRSEGGGPHERYLARRRTTGVEA